MELDDFLYTSAGRGRYACFTGTNRLMFITHRTDKYTELDEVKMVTKGGLYLGTTPHEREFEFGSCQGSCTFYHVRLRHRLCLLPGRRSGNGFQGRHPLCPFRQKRHAGLRSLAPYHRKRERGSFPCGGNSQHVRRYPESRPGRSFLHRPGPLSLYRDQKEPESGAGLGRISKIMEQCREAGLEIPIFAIGGIEFEDIAPLMETGIEGIAVSGAIINAEDPVEETRRFIREINKHNRTLAGTILKYKNKQYNYGK